MKSKAHLFLFCLVLPSLRADPAAEAAWKAAPEYRPERQLCGTIRLWGHGSTGTDFMRRLVTRWEKGFGRYEPGISFDYRMYGTASAIGALYAGVGDLAIMGEEIFPFEERAYEEAMGHAPASVEIATGSLAVRNFDFAQVFFVNRDNPNDRLTLAQLDAVIGTEHRRGAPRNFRTWGDLGLTGDWARRPIHVHAWSFDNDFWIYLDQALLGGSHRLNPDIREYAHIPRPDGTILDAGEQILEAVAQDPFALGLSNPRYANPRVKPLALSATDGGPFYAATAANLISRRYPLTRIIPAVYNQEPGRPPDPAVREFLRYLLSRDGQRDIAEDGEYLPLDPAALRRERAKLDAIDLATIRIWGDRGMDRVVGLWESGFRRNHPGARFETKLMGTGTAMAGLYTGSADIAFLGREVAPVENMAFAWVKRHRPYAVEVMAGSVETPGKSPALAVLVAGDNPISRVTLRDLDGIFGCERRRGGPPIRRWGQLGAGGDWAGRPISAFIRDTRSGTAAFFQAAVLEGGGKWNWGEVSDFRGEAEAIAALGRNRYGLAIASAHYLQAGLKILAVAGGPGEPAWLPTRENLAAGRYPLGRKVVACLDRKPGAPPDPKVRAFLSYILSPAGQDAVRAEGDFLPLPPPASPPEGKFSEDSPHRKDPALDSRRTP